MSRSHSRRQLASYRRRRRSPIPVLIFLAALVMLAVVLFQVFRSRGEAESLPSPSVIPSPVPSTPAPSDVPSPVPLEEAPWYLMLANLDHPLPADWEIETVTISNGLEVDQRIISALDDMLDDCRAAGLSPLVCSAYRTVQRQTELFEEKSMCSWPMVLAMMKHTPPLLPSLPFRAPVNIIWGWPWISVHWTIKFWMMPKRTPQNSNG